MSQNSLFLQPFSRFSRSAGTGGLLCQASQRGSRQTFQSGQNGLEFPLLFGGGFIKRRRFRAELNVDGLAVSVEELEPVMARLRQRGPAVKIVLRGDGGFCREKLMAWCEREGIHYIFGLAQNARLQKQIEPEMAQAEKPYEQRKAPARVFTEFFYATQDTWSRQRRVIAKAEPIADKANPRFVLTSLSQQRMAAQEWYEKGYCARGECPENRIKEQQLDLFADRTRTGKMGSNQLRL